MGIRFPMALVSNVEADDVVGRIRFRVVGGAQDRAAGILLRYRDPYNYLVARANSVEGDLRIFRTVNGLRRTLPGAVAGIALIPVICGIGEACASNDEIYPNGRPE